MTDDIIDLPYRARMGAPICFVNPDCLDVTPYFARYLRCLSTDYEFIYWDRFGAGGDGRDGYHCYAHKVPRDGGLGHYAALASGYAGFARFASRLLKRRNFERVVALTGNIGAILHNVLGQRYAGRYIVDVRDYFMENFKPYQQMEQKAIENAALTIVSSPAYAHFLGNHELVVLHNDQQIPPERLRELLSAQKVRSRIAHPIVIANIGTAKNIEYDQKVIEYFANDDRFELRFIGRGYDELADFCALRAIGNVVASGAFNADKTYDLYEDVDIVSTMYGFGKPHFEYMLSNKLYFSLRLDRPVLVCPHTYMAEIVDAYHLGVVLDLNDPSGKERIIECLSDEKTELRRRGAQSFLQIVEDEDRRALERIRAFLDVSRA